MWAGSVVALLVTLVCAVIGTLLLRSESPQITVLDQVGGALALYCTGLLVGFLFLWSMVLQGQPRVVESTMEMQYKGGEPDKVQRHLMLVEWYGSVYRCELIEEENDE